LLAIYNQVKKTIFQLKNRWGNTLDDDVKKSFDEFKINQIKYFNKIILDSLNNNRIEEVTDIDKIFEIENQKRFDDYNKELIKFLTKELKECFQFNKKKIESEYSNLINYVTQFEFKNTFLILQKYHLKKNLSEIFKKISIVEDNHDENKDIVKLKEFYSKIKNHNFNEFIFNSEDIQEIQNLFISNESYDNIEFERMYISKFKFENTEILKDGKKEIHHNICSMDKLQNISFEEAKFNFLKTGLIYPNIFSE
jgi:hypothetical protein